MNRKIIKALYKKEIMDILRDKKTLLMMIVVPLVLYPLIFIKLYYLISLTPMFQHLQFVETYHKVE